MAVPEILRFRMKIEVIWANFGFGGIKIPIVAHAEKRRSTDL